MDDKIHFLFNMYDVSHDNTVSKMDLTTLLNQIPKGALAQDYDIHYTHPPSPMPGDFARNRSNSGSSIALSETTDDATPTSTASVTGSASGHTRDFSTGAAMSTGPASTTGTQFGGAPGILERSESGSKPETPSHAPPVSAPLAAEFDYEDVDYYTNHDMVERAFAECDLNHEGRLTYEEFKMWVQRTPRVMEYIENILPYHGPKDAHAHHHKKDTLPHLRRIASRMSVGRSGSVQEAAGEVFNHSTSTHSSHLRSRSGTLRPGSAGNPRHSMSMQHLTLNINSMGGSSAPHSPMVNSGPHTTGGGGSAGPGGMNGPPSGLAISRASSFGFPTPMHAHSAHGAGDRFSTDLSSLCKPSCFCISLLYMYLSFSFCLCCFCFL